MKIDVVTCHEIDMEEYAALQRESFREILEATGVSDDYMTAGFYRWKYSTPARVGKVAVVRDEGMMVASNAMMALSLTDGTNVSLGWQSCDTATAPKARGKGYFKKCLKALEAVIADDEVFFGYPNKNSMHGFVKLGWTDLQPVPTFIQPLTVWKSGLREQIRPLESFDERSDRLERMLASEGRSMLVRSAAYLNWRYCDHPAYRYSSFGWVDGEELRGFVVLRKARIMKREFALVMEIWGTSHSVEADLLGQAQRWAREQRLNHIAMLTNRIPWFRALLSGYVNIPSRFLPKQQVLMGAAKEGAGARIIENRWTVQLGDWDGF